MFSCYSETRTGGGYHEIKNRMEYRLLQLRSSKRRIELWSNLEKREGGKREGEKREGGGKEREGKEKEKRSEEDRVREKESKTNGDKYMHT